MTEDVKMEIYRYFSHQLLNLKNELNLSHG